MKERRLERPDGLAGQPAERLTPPRGPPHWFYAGAILGPFAGGVIGVVVPALRSDFQSNLAMLSWAIWAAVPSAVTLAVANPRHRGTAASVNSSFKFAGTALGPAVYTPAYVLAPAAVFAVAAAGSLLLVVAAAAGSLRGPVPKGETSC